MPSHPTSAQSRASRLNGACSKGPASEAGKEKSSKNAVRHGLRADRFELADEEREDAASLRRDLSARLMPADAAERAVLEALVICEIKLARLDQLEMLALDQALMAPDAETGRRLPSLATLDRYRGRLLRERRELEARFETFQHTRSQFTDGQKITPDALRYLAELSERRAAEATQVNSTDAANDDGCTNEPEGGFSQAPSAIASGVEERGDEASTAQHH